MHCLKKAKATYKVLKIEIIKVCHGSLTVKTLAWKAGDPWFKSRLWRILILSIFRENLKNVSVCTEKGEILVAR